MKHQTILRPPTKRKCRKGHKMTFENTYWRGDGYPACRECMALADKRYMERKKGRA